MSFFDKLGMRYALVIIAAAIATLRLLSEPFANGAARCPRNCLFVSCQGGKNLATLARFILIAFSVGDVSTTLAEGVKDQRPLAIVEQALKTINAKPERLLVAFCGVEILFGGVLGDEAISLEDLETVLQAGLGTVDVSSGRAEAPANNRKTLARFRMSW